MGLSASKGTFGNQDNSYGRKLSARGGLSLRETSPYFIFTVATTGGAETFVLPAVTAGTYDCTIFWGDEASDKITAFNDSALTHTYADAGSHVITVKGVFTAMIFDDAGDKLKITNISNWGSNVWASDQTGAYRGCSNLVVSATDTPNWSNVTILSHFFRNCALANPVLADADVSNVTKMIATFNGASIFDKPIGSWDVSSVDDMNAMLRDTAFNQDVSSWDVSSVINMNSMFRGVTEFNQDISSWDVSNTGFMSSMFLSSGFAQNNYDLLLVAWDQLTLQNNVTAHFGSAKFGAGAPATAKSDIVANFTWSITDGGAA